jgi:hypothetical protein
MLEVAPFIVAMVLAFHYHDDVPSWVWVVCIVALFSSNTINLTRKRKA